MALGVGDKHWDDDERYSSGSYSDDSPILSYRYDKNRNPKMYNIMEEREKRSTFCAITKLSLFCTVIIFCVLMYIPLYTKANYSTPKGFVEGWLQNTNRDTKIYVQPHNVTIIHEPKQLCPEPDGIENRLFLLVVVCSATTNFAEREAIRKTWGSYENYKKTSKVFNLVSERYKNYNYTYDLYSNATEPLSDTLKFNRTDVASAKKRLKRNISSYKNLLPVLASALENNLKTIKTDVVTEQEEKRFEDDVVLPDFDMNKELGEDKENEETNLYEYGEETNVMKIPKENEENKDLSNIFSKLKVSDFPENVERSKASNTAPEFKLVFLLGLPAHDNESAIQNRINEEVKEYDDIIQESFLDTYNNLTIKSIMMLKHVTTKCVDSVRYILKSDDDMYINMPNLMQDLRKRAEVFDKEGAKRGKDATSSSASESDNTKEYLLIGDLICGAKPVTDVRNKWFSPRYMYSGRVYPCYVSGVAYLMSGLAARAIYHAALITPLFHLEDIFITGMSAKLARPRLRPQDDPLFSYVAAGASSGTPAGAGLWGPNVSEHVACTTHSMVTTHRVAAVAMPVLHRAMLDVQLVDRCERKRLTDVKVRREQLRRKNKLKAEQKRLDFMSKRGARISKY